LKSDRVAGTDMLGTLEEMEIEDSLHTTMEGTIMVMTSSSTRETMEEEEESTDFLEDTLEITMDELMTLEEREGIAIIEETGLVTTHTLELDHLLLDLEGTTRTTTASLEIETTIEITLALMLQALMTLTLEGVTSDVKRLLQVVVVADLRGNSTLTFPFQKNTTQIFNFPKGNVGEMPTTRE